MSVFPLVLAHPHIRRILEHHAQTLILTRHIKTDSYEIHDALTIQQNARHRQNGRHDLQRDPLVFKIQIDHIKTIPLLDLDLKTVRSAGFKTLEDFYLDWLARRRRIHTDLEAHICDFRIVEDARYLHARVHRGYTTNPSQAAHGEPQALSRTELDELARQAQHRRETEQAEEIFRQRGRSLAIRFKQAVQEADRNACAHLAAEMLAITTGGTIAA